MEEEHIIFISRLIFRSMTDELNDSERKILDQWISQNQQRYEKIVLSNDFPFEHQRNRVYNPKRALPMLHRKMSHLTPRRRAIYLSRRIAAVVIPLLVVSAVWLMRSPEKTARRDVLARQSTERANKAQLILGDGQVLDLSSNEHLKSENFDIGRTAITYKNSDSVRMTRNTILVPVGGVFTVKLPDGTEVNLNSDSKLIFPTRFDAESREVFLSGEAYFSVVKGAKPFVVNTELGRIKVYGTEFNIKQYPVDNTLHATLVKGSISYSNKVISETRIAVSQQLNYTSGQTKCSIVNVDTRIYTAWREGVFCFEEETLYNIMQTLSRWYGVKFEIRDQALKSKRLSGQLGRYSSIKSFVDMFNLYDGITCRIEGDSMIIIE